MATRLIDLPFTAGINESVDPTVTQLPAMTSLVNYRLTRAGRLEHRLGVKDVSLSLGFTSGYNGAAIYDNKVQAISGRFVAAGGHGFTNTGVGEWACAGSVSRFVPWATFEGLGDSTANYSGCSCTSVRGFAVVGGQNSTNPAIWPIRIYDEITGALILDGYSGDPTGSPDNIGRVVACGLNKVVAVTMRNDTGAFNGATLDLSVLPLTNFPAVTNIVTAAGAIGYGFDAAPCDSSSYIISYYTGAGARIARVDCDTHAILQSQTVATAGQAYTTCITIGSGVTVKYALAWMDQVNADIRCAIFDNNLTQIGTTQVVGTATATSVSSNRFHPVLGTNGSSEVLVGWTDSYASGSFGTYRTTFRTVTTTPTLGTTYGPYYGTYLASKPFQSSLGFVQSLIQPAVWLANYNPTATEVDRSYFLVTLGASTDQKAVFEMSASPSAAAPVSALLGAKLQVSEVPQTTATGQLYRQVAFPEVFRGVGTSSTQRRAQVYRFGDAARSHRSRPRCIVPCQGSFVVLGGAPRYYDKSWLNEVGFAHGPTVISATPGVTGGMSPSKTYRYVFVLEYFDALGQRQLSYPSSPVSVTLGAGDGQVNFEILAPGIWATGNAASYLGTGLPDPRKVVVRAYRTAGDSGTVFRYTPTAFIPPYADAGPLIANGRVQYQDSSSDASIAGNEAVYIQVGNARSNYRAPPCRFGCEHEGRLVVAGGWNPYEFRTSKFFFPGEGIQFADDVAFTGVNPEPITGCASLDSSLILFSARGIYTVSGDGPLDDGSGSFATPRKLPGRVGCVDWRSVVTMPDGVFFRSAEGMCLLPRGLNSAQFIGAAIKEKLRAYPETLAAASTTRAVVSTIADHDSEQVVAWLVGDQEDPTATAIFTYSLGNGTWGQISLPSEVGNPQVMMGVWEDLTNNSDVLAFGRKVLEYGVTGSLLVENVGTGYDQDIDGSYEPLLNGSWVTGKIFPFGFGGRGSVRSIRLVGECLASNATTITPTVYTDAPDDSAYTGAPIIISPGRFAVEFPFRRRDLAWVQVGIADPVSGAGNRGAGLRFNGLSLEVEMEPGQHRSNPTDRSA